MHKFFSVIRNVVLATVIYEPERLHFSIIAGRYPRLINCITLLFCVYIGFIIFLLSKVVINSSATGSFIVNARTERVEYQPESIDPPRITFANATFHWEEQSSEIFDPTASGSTPTKTLLIKGSGSIQIHGQSSLIFSRIGNGDLHIRIKSQQPLAVYDENDEKSRALPPAVDLVMSDLPGMLNQGISWKYNLDGPLSLGRVPSYGAQQMNGLLLEGDVQMVARQLLSENHYKVEPYKLQLGDELAFLPSTPKTSGLLTFDAERGLKVAAIVEAKSAIVRKFRDTNIKIQNNLWSKLGKDEELVITWALLLTVPGSLVFLSRLLSYHLQMQTDEE